MSIEFRTSDILHFEKYCFTDSDNPTYARHYALVLLPPAVMNYSNNLLCAVITSKKTKYFALKLLKSKYSFFNVDSYVCFRRRDINPLTGLSNKKQPVGKLDQIDIERAFKIIKRIYNYTSDVYLMATVVREWKKIL
ncbi:MAG: hypothetical protein WCT33_03930 [Patescibacteria group bacterium]|jgi:hypothetical protein